MNLIMWLATVGLPKVYSHFRQPKVQLSGLCAHTHTHTHTHTQNTHTHTHTKHTHTHTKHTHTHKTHTHTYEHNSICHIYRNIGMHYTPLVDQKAVNTYCSISLYRNGGSGYNLRQVYDFQPGYRMSVLKLKCF